MEIKKGITFLIYGEYKTENIFSIMLWKGKVNMSNNVKQGVENERRIENIETLVEKQTRTERHLEEHSDISHSPKNIQHAKEVQRERQSEIDHLKDKIVYGDNVSNNQKENTEKRLVYTEGYLNHNADHMSSQDFQNAKAKQERRKEQLDSINSVN